MMMKKTILPFAFALAFVAVGCDDDDDDIVNPPAGNATVRFVNATSDVAAFDVAAGSSVLASNVAARGTSSCVTVPVSTQSVALRQVGGTSNLGTFTFSPALGADKKLTLIALGTTTGLQFVQTADEFTPPGSNLARVRVINATTSTTPFDVFITAPNDPMETPDAAALAAKASTQFLEIPAGATVIRVANAGSTDVLIDTSTLNLAAGDVRTIVLLDDPNATTDFGFVTISPCN
jgi:hypothetical protein